MTWQQLADEINKAIAEDRVWTNEEVTVFENDEQIRIERVVFEASSPDRACLKLIP